MAYAYKNKATGQVVSYPGPNARLERLERWERVGPAEEAEPEQEAADWPGTHAELDALGEEYGVEFPEGAKVVEKQELLAAAGVEPPQDEEE